MGGNVYIYIAVMSLVSFAVRVLPLTLIRGQIKSPFIRSFLHYVPYVTLAVMTFPAILESTEEPWISFVGFGAAMVMAYRGVSLFAVSMGCCLLVFLLQLM